MKRFFYLSAYLFLILSSLSSAAQEVSPDYSLAGFWRGAIIRTGNSIQVMEAEIYPQGDSMVIAIMIPEWTFRPAQVRKLEVEQNVVRFDAIYGQARMILDSSFMEMVGTVGSAYPPINFHLKKSLRPYRPQIEEQALVVNRAGAKLGGTLFLPSRLQEPAACAILVHGRGCGPRQYLAARARKLAEYGIATYAYDKRGSAPTGFDCVQSNHEMVVQDLVAVIQMLAEQTEIDPERIGLLSYSAGAWIVPDAARRSKVPVAFMATVVGPPTSVREQQFDGVEAFALVDNYSEAALQEALEYTELTFSEEDPQQIYPRMQELLVLAEQNGWRDWLADTDIPPSAEKIPELWVRRFAYDPGEDLKQFQGPFLSILSEDDPVVPYQKQVQRFQELFGAAGKENYSIKILQSAGHGRGHGARVRDLGYNETLESTSYYYKYYRPAYGSIQYIVDFLEENGFLD